MEKVSDDQLNEAAIQIILHAGKTRTLLNEALNEMYEKGIKTEDKLKEAKAEIVCAHKLQTEMIQSTIEDDDMQSTLLFSHAQDTLMTIYSELNMANHMIKMYQSLLDKIERGDGRQYE